MDVLELLDLMVQGVAPGIIENGWDFTPNSQDPDFYEEWYAVAQALKWAVKDRIDRLRIERNPATAEEKLQDFELALGLQFSNTTQFGTIAQRQAQVVGRFRESGPLTIAGIQTVMQAYFKYADPADILVIEPDRPAQTAAHTYDFGTATADAGGRVDLTTNVTDDSFVSDMGAQVRLTIDAANPFPDPANPAYVILRGPDGFEKQWDLYQFRTMVTAGGMGALLDVVLYAPEFGPKLQADRVTYARQDIRGVWEFKVRRLKPGDNVTLANVFVEGVGRNAAGQDGLGAALFEWGVVAQTSKLGAGYDLIGAAAAVQRINHVHLIGSLIRDASDGSVLPAIPDDPNAIPNQSIPG